MKSLVMKRLFLLLTFLFAPLTYADCDFKADTASQTFLIGPFLDQTDGITAETGLTIANTDIRVSKNGGNMAAKNSGGGTHDEEGLYQITLDATDTNTEGTLQLSIQDVVNHVPVWHNCLVLGADEFDRKYGTTAQLTSRDTGLMLLTTITTATSPTELDLAAGASNDDAYNNATVTFVGGTEECERKITNYTGSGAILFIDSACPFTLASADTVRIHAGGSGDAQETAQSGVDSNGSAIAALNDITADDVWDEVVETAGATFTGRCLLAALGAYVAGEFNTSGNTTTYQDTGGNTTRIVGTVVMNGRDTMSITCP